MATIDVSRPIEEIKSKLPSSLKYPVASAAELKAAPTRATVTVAGREVQLDAVLSQLPAKKYPILSAADLQSKVQAHVTARAASASKGLASLTVQLPSLKYPIANAAQFVAQAGVRHYTYHGQAVDLAKVASHLTAADFPITSAADLDTKTSSLAVTLALTTPGPKSVL
jgi:hypothetical protein